MPWEIAEIITILGIWYNLRHINIINIRIICGAGYIYLRNAQVGQVYSITNEKCDLSCLLVYACTIVRGTSSEPVIQITNTVRAIRRAITARANTVATIP